MSDLRDKVIAAMLEAAAQRGDRKRVAYYEEADAAIAVVLEEAAKIVEEDIKSGCQCHECMRRYLDAKAIRALMEK